MELTETLADDLKAEFRKHVDKAATELSEGLQKELEKRFGVPRSLREAHLSTVQEHEIEIELYVDDLAQQSLRQQQGLAPRQEYTFYGNVGAVQTGPHASANIVQNLEAKDNEALLSALENVQCWLDTAEALDRVQRQELAELIEESVAELRSGKPNNTKLRSLLTTVGNTILGVASLAQAYHTLKAALLPLGIILP
ncbi:MAG: hypothetical protein FJY85_24535 [Deltaproteobacteria bacterium]|nr:hypothetical protein [Deltaproteobacteria bacterium]